MVPLDAYKKKSRFKKKIIVHGTNNIDVVPFDTYLAILLSASYKNESFHVFFLGQKRCGLEWVRVVRWCEWFAGASGQLGRVVRWFAWLRLGSRGSDGGWGSNMLAICVCYVCVLLGHVSVFCFVGASSCFCFIFS